MVNLAYVTPEQKPFTIGEESNYQFIYTKYDDSIESFGIDRKVIELAKCAYNGSFRHHLIFEMHNPIMGLIKETNLDNVDIDSTVDKVSSIIKKLIEYDYRMFIDAMTILAAMLESADSEQRVGYLEFVIDSLFPHDLEPADGPQEFAGEVNASNE